MTNNKVFVILLIILSLVLTYTHVHAAVIDVPADQPTIQAGINAAEDGDTVLVTDGIYRGEGNVNIDFMGKQITVKSLNGAKATIIDCGRKTETRGFTFQNEETHDSVLEGFTIKNGVHKIGGGISCNMSSPTIRDCIITQNRATSVSNNDGGGGIYSLYSSPLISGCTITHNIAASRDGGGIYFSQRKLIVDGVSTILPPPNLINCDISNNIGIGILCNRSTPVIKDSTIFKNSEQGIVCYYFSLGVIVENCRIEKNAGGVICTEMSSLTIKNSVIKQNTSPWWGGGIFCSKTSFLDVSGCIIAENTANLQGGGIYFGSNHAEATIIHCTITENIAGEKGGGISVVNNGHFELTDSIVWGNSSNGTHEEIYRFQIQGRMIIKSCDIRDGLNGINQKPDGILFIYADNIDADPLFVDADRGDYRLKRNSPAAEMGAHAVLGGPFSVSSVGKRLVIWGELKRNK